MNENAGFLQRYFKLKERHTDVRTEIVAGITSFVATAYIMFVHPNIMADAGVPKDAAIAATIWLSALVTAMIGFIADYPMALAPAMGINTFFAYYVCGVMHLHWTVALGAVFFSGILFLILTIGGIRQAIIGAVPKNIRNAIGVGIGLFIAFVGLKETGLIVADPSTFIRLGSVTAPETGMAMFGLLLTAGLMVRNVQGAILIGIIVTTLLSMAIGIAPVPQSLDQVISTSVPSVSGSFGVLDIAGAWNLSIVSVIFTFTMVELFDGIGVLIALTGKAGRVDKDGKIENLDKALKTVASGTILSAVFGSSAVAVCVEGAAGIAAGGRTGLTAIVASVMFLLSLLIVPLIGLVPEFVTAPALILVGAMMMSSVREVEFNDFSEGLPAFLTIIMMPMTSSIANGFAFGFVSYVILKTMAGHVKEIPLTLWIISTAFLVNLTMLG